MIGAGGTTSEASNSPVEIVSNEELSTATLEQTAKDTGSAAAIKPLTDLMDFKINIADSSQHGTIQSVSFKLSATESNLVYYKLDSITNTYYEFNYDSATGEGARFSKSNDSLGYNDIMTLFIRDNGVHDSDSTEGVIRDPGYIGAVATATLQKAENTVVETVEPNSNETGTSNRQQITAQRPHRQQIAAQHTHRKQATTQPPRMKTTQTAQITIATAKHLSQPRTPTIHRRLRIILQPMMQFKKLNPYR